MKNDQELDRRSQVLKSKLEKQKKAYSTQDDQEKRAGYRAYNDGFRLVIEFVSAIFVGGLLGYFIDANVGTLPFGLIIGILLGFATGVYNLVKYGQTHAEKNNAKFEKVEDDANLAK